MFLKMQEFIMQYEYINSIRAFYLLMTGAHKYRETQYIIILEDVMQKFDDLHLIKTTFLRLENMTYLVFSRIEIYIIYLITWSYDVFVSTMNWFFLLSKWNLSTRTIEMDSVISEVTKLKISPNKLRRHTFIWFTSQIVTPHTFLYKIQDYINLWIYFHLRN